MNVCSRLERQTKTHGMSILTGAETMAAAPVVGYIFALVDTVRAKGKEEAVDVYTLLGGPDYPVDQASIHASEHSAAYAATKKAGDPTGMGAALAQLGALDVPRFRHLAGVYRDQLAA